MIKLGKRIASEAGLPLYIHLGQLWPTRTPPPWTRTRWCARWCR
ncbi:MAG: hypothetical protein WDN49_16670 [Acetobacteraceae bacterium]